MGTSIQISRSSFVFFVVVVVVATTSKALSGMTIKLSLLIIFLAKMH
jgi:hypothetical protein